MTGNIPERPGYYDGNSKLSTHWVYFQYGENLLIVGNVEAPKKYRKKLKYKKKLKCLVDRDPQRKEDM